MAADSIHADNVEAEPVALREGERWFVVHTLPSAERRAQAQLENQQFPTFLPKRLKAGDLPCPVPRGVIESMAALADPNGVLQLRTDLKVGAPVRLATGPFSEQIGVLDRLDDSGRIRVLLNILGRQELVRLTQAEVLPAA